MTEHDHVGALEITSDLAYERREWLVERIGCGFLGLILAAAVLGLFGSGPLANAEVGPHAGPLWIEYSRFERKLSPSTLSVHVTPAALANGELRLRLDGDYARAINVTGAMPAPTSEEFSADSVIFIFAASMVRGPAQIDLEIYPNVMGRVQGSVGLDAAPPLTFTQFIYP